jgi:hypothetical protein
MRIKLIEDLPLATRAQSCPLNWISSRILVGLRRILHVRARLNAASVVFDS